MKHRSTGAWDVCCVVVAWFSFAGFVRASDASAESRLRLLQQQNESLQTQVRQQQDQIDALTREVAAIRASHPLDSPETPHADDGAMAGQPGFGFGRLQISGEAAVGLFETGSEGMFPNAEFRVDEAKLFVDAPIWGNVYAYLELNIAARESSDVDVSLGELYFEVEDISRLWGRDRQLNLRAGRLDIPFGEEYLSRDAIDNPLISHSLPDFWGVDEGVELYGSVGRASYVVAVQNGGVPVTRDFNADKSVAGRMSFDPTRRLHFSVSGVRTGDLSARNDFLSELWFGNGWIRSLGSPATTTFHANLVQGDITLQLPRSRLGAFGGYIRYGDNDPAADNGRDVFYYAVEGTCEVTRKLYLAARFSHILAPDGFPVVGHGARGEYLFGSLTEDLWRLSMGVGYRWSPRWVVKTEYSLERGKETGGERRNHEDLLAAQAAFAF